MEDEIKQSRKEWLKANCPICGAEYEYLPKYKPATCSKFRCLQEYHKQATFGRGAM